MNRPYYGINMNYEPIIGLEIHAEMQTASKMFCSCPVVDSTLAEPNMAVCPVCAGMPGLLPVANQRAVEYGIRVALALGCEINPRSIFARKNYFYPDLPKGYQISQYEEPLARNGMLRIRTSGGVCQIRVRRVHLEEDTGKLTHVNGASLIDLNRAGVPLLEIVSEPDIRSGEEARAYAEALRSILRYLGVNSGDMQKGVMRIEPNVSVRPMGTETLGTRTEIKNLNSFRALERGIAYEVERQIAILEGGGRVRQETVGWNEIRQATFVQRVKEAEDDYRYFPEPDLPPLVVTKEWVEEIRASLPELPAAKSERFQETYQLSDYDASLLVTEQATADYFEATVKAAPQAAPKTVANWITGELFGLMNQSGEEITSIKVSPDALIGLVKIIEAGVINHNTAKSVLAEMFESGRSAEEIVEHRGLRQISDTDQIQGWVKSTLQANPDEVKAFLAGKETLSNWFFGQVMREAKGKANPLVVREELARQLSMLEGEMAE
jgi:aspartyl-tRNA(Asn)/glutamyl-tRNA(Gln) amidotransferase subunit B